MIKSLVLRFVTGILILWIISIIGFWLSKKAPGDAIMDYLSIDDPRYNINSNPLELRSAYIQIAHRRGLDLPLFYWSVSSGYSSDAIDYIFPLDDRKTLKAWIEFSKNEKASLQLYNQLSSGLYASCGKTGYLQLTEHVCQTFNRTMKTRDLNLVEKNIQSLSDTLQNLPLVDTQAVNQLSAMLTTCGQLLDSSHAFAFKNSFLSFRWHGTHNQYHQWMTGLLSQRPLTSLVDGLNAWSKIYDALKWTILLNGLAFLMAMLLGVFIGIWSGTHHGRSGERVLNWILFALFALPSFWLGTLFIFFLTSGEWLSIFPSGGLGSYQSAGTWIEKWSIIFFHLILPVTCLALGALAYVSRQVKQSILHEFTQPYVKALRAQGISEKTILRRHVIKNALFPVITIIGGSIPAILSGSLIIEVIYSIPGMGRLMYNSLLSHDWPVVFPILMLGAAITVFSYVLTDVVYKWADPRVKTI
jgi:peptide/nickel transport system permease protein